MWGALWLALAALAACGIKGDPVPPDPSEANGRADLPDEGQW